MSAPPASRNLRKRAKIICVMQPVLSALLKPVFVSCLADWCTINPCCKVQKAIYPNNDFTSTFLRLSYFVLFLPSQFYIFFFVSICLSILSPYPSFALFVFLYFFRFFTVSLPLPFNVCIPNRFFPLSPFRCFSFSTFFHFFFLSFVF